MYYTVEFEISFLAPHSCDYYEPFTPRIVVAPLFLGIGVVFT